MRVRVAVGEPWLLRRVRTDLGVGGGVEVVVNGTPLGPVRVRISAVRVAVGVPWSFFMVIVVRFAVLARELIA